MKKISKSKLYIIIVTLSLVSFGLYTLAKSQYIQKEALVVSKAFINYLWNGEFDKAYKLSYEKTAGWNTYEDFKEKWLFNYPKEYTNSRSYSFYSDETYKPIISPYQSKGNYLKRLILKRNPTTFADLNFIYLIDSRNPDEKFPNHITSISMKMKYDGNKWRIINYSFTAW